jgi:hypothetical protein
MFVSNQTGINVRLISSVLSIEPELHLQKNQIGTFRTNCFFMISDQSYYFNVVWLICVTNGFDMIQSFYLTENQTF